MQNYANYHIQNVLNLVMIFITVWEYELCESIFMGSWVISCKAVALQPHVLISGHGAVLKLPCTAQQEAIHLFLAIFPSLPALLQHLSVFV